MSLWAAMYLTGARVGRRGGLVCGAPSTAAAVDETLLRLPAIVTGVEYFGSSNGIMHSCYERGGNGCTVDRAANVTSWRRYCTSSNSNNSMASSIRGNNNGSLSSNNKGMDASSNNSPESGLLKQLKDQIRMTGPITVHQYMRAVLTHPRGGYYMDHDPLGEAGDFITSPEISQMFGELLGVWVYSEWHKMGKEMPLQLVELGPGRGTLVKDVLRSVQQLGLTGEAVHVHLVEISPYYRRLQRRLLCPSAPDLESDPSDSSSPTFTSLHTPIHWHQHLDTVPEGFSIFLAHEFFDALPVHKLVRTDAGAWREMLIDISGDVGYGGYGDAATISRDFEALKEDANNASKDEVGQTPNKEASKVSKDGSDVKGDTEQMQLRYVLSREATPAATFYTKNVEGRDMIEVCPDAALLAGQIGARITERGGTLLVVDYGHTGTKGDTFRAFRRHQQQHPLLAPSSADLTADVDFSLLKKALPETVISFGPVSQGFFLKNMGIELRLLKLLQSCKTPSVHASLVSSYRRLVEEMGGAFSVFAVYPRVMDTMLKKHPPPGFVRQLDEGWSSAIMQRVEDIRKKTVDGHDSNNRTKNTK